LANLTLLGVPISARAGSGGGGIISIIQNGVKPANGTSGNDSNQWDSFAGGGQSTDWIGLEMFGTVSFTSVMFQEGGAFSDGGWFTSTPTIQVRQSGVWNNVTGQGVTPSYNANNTTSFEQYTFTFDAIQGDAIRVSGTPGGSMTFISCGELEVYGDLVSMADVTSSGTASSDTTPTGGGAAISAIKNGVLGTTIGECFDTYDGGAADSDDWIAYTFSQNYEFRALTFFCGATYTDGGVFTATPTVEVRVSGVWTAVSSQALKTQGAAKGGAVGTSYVTTIGQEPFRAYIFTFTAITGDGIRLRGDPGGTANFIACSEMRAVVTSVSDQTITCSGIGSSVAFGTSRLDHFLNATGISTSEAFGVLKAELGLAPAGIASSAQPGSPSVQMLQSVSPSGIATSENVPGPRVDLNLASGSISTSAALGNPMLGLNLEPVAIATSVQFGSQRFDLDVTPTGIASGVTFGSQAVMMVQSITTTGIATSEAFPSPTVTPEGISVLPSSIASSFAAGSPQFDQFMLPNGIPTSVALGAQAFNLNVVATGIVSTEAIPQPRVDETINAIGVSTSEVVSNPAVVPQAATISPSGTASGVAFGDSSVSSGAGLVAPSGITSSESVPSPTVQPQTATVSPNGIASAAQPGSPQFNLDINGQGISTQAALGQPRIDESVQPVGIPSQAAPGEPIVGVAGANTIQPSAVPSSEQFGSAAVVPQAANVSPLGIGSQEAHGSTTVVPDATSINPNSIPSSESVPSPLIQPDAAQINVFGIPTAVIFGDADVAASETQIVGPQSIQSSVDFGSALFGLGLIPASIPSQIAFGLPAVYATLGVPAAFVSLEVLRSPTLGLDIQKSPIVQLTLKNS
jgi:hypothetical protein